MRRRPRPPPPPAGSRPPCTRLRIRPFIPGVNSAQYPGEGAEAVRAGHSPGGAGGGGGRRSLGWIRDPRKCDHPENTIGGPNPLSRRENSGNGDGARRPPPRADRNGKGRSPRRLGVSTCRRGPARLLPFAVILPNSRINGQSPRNHCSPTVRLSHPGRDECRRSAFLILSFYCFRS